jgi:type VI secretion system protein ImpB
MARKESSVAPKERINVTFKPATGGAVEEIELPMKVMVVGDFLQRHDPRSLLDRKPISVNKNNFKDVMTNQKLTLEITVPNVLQDGDPENELPIKLSFSDMRDFEPGNIINQVPETRKLYQIREALVSLKGPMGNIPSFRQTLDDVVKDPKQSEIIKKELAAAGIDLSLTPKSTGKGQENHDFSDEDES